MRVFDEVEWLEFRPDQPTFHKRFSGFYSGRRPYTNGSTIDDERLGLITKMPEVKRIDLTWTNVGDTGIKHLCQLTKLEELRLKGTDVTDACIPYLIKLRYLTRLDVGETAITKRGAETLQAHLPACIIRFSVNKWYAEE